MKRFGRVYCLLFLPSEFVDIFHKGCHACNTHCVISSHLFITFTIDHFRGFVTAAIDISYTWSVYIIVLNAQLFLWPQLIPHIEYSLSQSQKKTCVRPNYMPYK